MAEELKIPTGIIVGAGVAAVSIAGILIYLATRAKGLRADVAWASILPYLVIAYHYNPKTGSWKQVLDDTSIIDGSTYSITVTQNCTLSYNGYFYGLSAGDNTIVWEEV